MAFIAGEWLMLHVLVNTSPCGNSRLLGRRTQASPSATDRIALHHMHVRHGNHTECVVRL